jgi:transcriptional regulator with XRE-family HTH domain
MSSKTLTRTDNVFGARLRQARKALGLTQAKFAKEIGITNCYVSDLEKGKVRKPSEPVLRTILFCFRLNRDWLSTGEGPMFVEPEEGVGPKSHPAQAAVDVDLLAGVIGGVESELSIRQVDLPHDKKARLIALLYEYFVKTSQKVENNKIIEYLSLTL